MTNLFDFSSNGPNLYLRFWVFRLSLGWYRGNPVQFHIRAVEVERDDWDSKWTLAVFDLQLAKFVFSLYVY